MYFQAKNLHKTFYNSEKQIQNVVGGDSGINLELEKGRLLCILGPSGCGKSTMLNIIAGLEENDREYPLELVLDNQSIQKLPPAKRNIGFVFQSGALFNHLNVLQNVTYGLISKGLNKKTAVEKAGEYLKYFDLQGYEKREPQTLSGGERQRVALARTLITNPALVLLDEPFSALDTDLRKRMALQLKEWQKELGFTAIMVTHDENEAKTTADSIIRL